MAALKLCMDRMLPVTLFEKEKNQRSAVNITISGIGGIVPTASDDVMIQGHRFLNKTQDNIGGISSLNFGAKGMNIKKNNPKRRAAFRARHNCANPGPRTKARYWSCRKW